jgi:hypothetical protein
LVGVGRMFSTSVEALRKDNRAHFPTGERRELCACVRLCVCLIQWCVCASVCAFVCALVCVSLCVCVCVCLGV